MHQNGIYLQDRVPSGLEVSFPLEIHGEYQSSIDTITMFSDENVTELPACWDLNNALEFFLEEALSHGSFLQFSIFQTFTTEESTAFFSAQVQHDFFSSQPSF